MTCESPLFDSLPAPNRCEKVEAFVQLLKAKSEEIVSKASALTHTPVKYHGEDMMFAYEAMVQLLQPISAPKNMKFRPKGRVLMGLSVNEPLVVGIVPVVAALLAGNEVLLRSASVNRSVMQDITSLFYEAGFTQSEISLIPQSRDVVAEEVKKSDFVFWFGSYKTCKEIALQCINVGVPFAYEAEGYDLAILDDTLNNSAIYSATVAVIKSVIRHDGQTCQAIRGAFVPQNAVEPLREVLDGYLPGLKIGYYLDPMVDCTAMPQVRFIEKPTFDFAPFSSKLWISRYRDWSDLPDIIARNPYRLSITIFSESPSEKIFKLASHYKCSRLLINDYPEKVGTEEPWGGIGFSGTTGPTLWVEKFIDKTFIREGSILSDRVV